MANTPDWRRCIKCSRFITLDDGEWHEEDLSIVCPSDNDLHEPGILIYDFPGQHLNLTADEEARETYAARARTALYDMFVEFESEHIDDLDPRTIKAIGLFGYLMRHPEAPVPDFPEE